MFNSKKKNVVVISGGSGNTAIVTSLLEDFKNINLNILVNAYDNGKSTGICRKITNTLGVSDIRKNHFKIYKILHQYDENGLDNNLVEFYKARLNLTKGKEIEEATKFVEDLGLSQFSKYIKSFFEREEAKNIEFKDFSIANIVYSEMYSYYIKEYGPEAYTLVNDKFTDLLNIPKNTVVLNSFDNIYLHAITESRIGSLGEEDIVEYKNAEDKIDYMCYDGNNTGLNPQILEILMNADYIIISTGTFWSSIYPTLDYLHLYKLINDSKARKLWFINSEEDKDSYGVSSNDFINRLDDLGLNLKDFTIIENEEATPSLREYNDKYDIAYTDLGNIDGVNESAAITLALKEYGKM